MTNLGKYKAMIMMSFIDIKILTLTIQHFFYHKFYTWTINDVRILKCTLVKRQNSESQ